MGAEPLSAPAAWLTSTAVFAGGAVGSLARGGLAEIWPPRAGEWPYATFVANLAGAALLGWVATRAHEHRYLRPLLATGLCGALTTFSTFQIEVIRLAEDGRAGVAVTYTAVSLALGMALAASASSLARRS